MKEFPPVNALPSFIHSVCAHCAVKAVHSIHDSLMPWVIDAAALVLIIELEQN